MEALVRQRFGFQRFPVAPAVVFMVTATTSDLQAVVPGMLAGLQRTPEGLEGGWWRTFTALFVQDGGVAGTLSNLAFLAGHGRPGRAGGGAGRWLACYFGAGLAGYAWQPRGRGTRWRSAASPERWWWGPC